MSSLASKFSAARSRPARWLRRVVRWLLLGVAGLWLLILALWLGLHWLILPNVDRWRPELEARATQWLGSSVRIESIQVRTGGWMPVVALRNVRLLDAQGQPALTLPEVSAALSVRSFFWLQPRLEQLYLDQPSLSVRIDAQGQLWVAGQALSPSSSGSTAAADWLFSQYEVAIRGGSLTWLDERRPGATPLQLTQVDLVLRNSLRRHEARLDATPPPEWGQRFTARARLTQPLLARAGDWRRWSGLAYVDLPQARMAQARQHLKLPFELTQGEGRVRAWARIEQGRTRAVDADVGLTQLDLRLGAQTERLQLAYLQARLGWQQTPEGSRWQAKNLAFALAGEQQAEWPSSQITLSLRHADARAPWEPGAVQGGQLQADRLDLALLAQLGRALPLGDTLQSQLSARQPQGQITSLDAGWDGALDARALPTSWRLSAAAKGLALQALPAPEASAERPYPLGQPGWEGADLSVSASERGGQARLTLRNGSLSWPGLLIDTALPLPQADIQGSWQRVDGGWDVRLEPSTLTTPDAELKLDGRWRSSPNPQHPRGLLTLNASAPKLDVRALPRYIPAQLPNTRRYLAESLQSGTARSIQLRLDGPLHAFPFEAPGTARGAGNAASKGVFRVTARADKVRYAFVPSHEADATRPAYTSPWAALDDVNGDLVFEGPGLVIRNARAKLGELDASNIKVRIADLAHAPVVEVEGQWRGTGAAALAYVKSSPIAGWTQRALDNARATGPVQGTVKLALPLANMAASRAQGDVQLAGIDLQLRPDLPALTQVRARVDYTQSGFTLQPSSAQFVGGELRIEGGTQPDRSTRLNATGTATAEGLRAATEWAPMPSLAQHLAGSARYQARLQWKDGSSDIDVRSSLQGLSSSLPEPLRKAPETTLPLHLNLDKPDAVRERLAIDLGTLVSARYERERSSGMVQRGAVRVGGPNAEPSLPDSGVALQLKLARLDLDAWLPLARQLGTSGTASTAAHTAGSGSSHLPNHGSVQADTLRLQGRTLNGVVAGVSLRGNQQRVNLQSDLAAGYLEWTADSAGGPGRLLGRLTRLSLPKSEAERVEQWVDQGRAAQTNWPAVDLVVDDFELRGLRLGRLALQAQAAAAGRDWPISSLHLQHPDAVLTAHGAWRPLAGRTEMEGTLLLSNGGRWLDALGYPGTVRGAKGEMKGQLGWKGSPLSPDPALFDGQFTVQLERGQFLKAEPGVARLLSVLSLQSLPRRLLFDWRDVFSDGFAFDDFGGTVSLQSGVARTDNLRMRGVQASVLMDGSANLANQTADLRVLIVPDVNVGGASLAYAAINPTVGLTTFLAQLILRRPLAAAGTTQFHVRGPWAAPQVDKIDKPELPATAAPAPTPTPASPPKAS